MLLLSRLGRKRLCWLGFRVILLSSIFLSIGVFVSNVVMNKRPSIIQQSQDAFKLREKLKVKAPKFYEENERPLTTGGANKKRLNLIIVAHGRSGSTFLGNIFNHHPSVFYLFEPYQTVERIVRAQAPFNQHYQETAFRWMQGVFQCDFVSAAHVDDLQSYYRKKYPENYNPMKSLVLLSPPFCRYNATDPRWTLDSCPPLDQQTMEEECKNKYRITVAKVLISRMPEQNLKQLLSICDTSDQFDCKLLFLVRDPRGIIPSSKAVGFYGDKDGTALNGTEQFSQSICGLTEANLKIIRSLRSPEKSQFMLLRYEDLAANPLKTLPSLLKFAGLPMDESMSNWLYLASHLPETESERKAARWRQDSQEGAERWRWKVKPGTIAVIEQQCKHVMNILGYKPVNGSRKIQTNLTVSLLKDNYEALQWFND
ncbi:carbohydrate sulfotransferase 1-like [Orbicella faveolata]|uniref:carbohydrate sulfotransferase 1-like n=2 Tax=Orbicella faveolata TaxID=48498 RepID=UPI0009E5E3BA|nr:carbohydrate sulfotransferase 1-like [Orbicella faveolata]